MAFDNTFTAVTGATLAASDWNTYVKGNFTEVWKGTTAGDIDYYTSATAKSRLALGAANTVLISNGTAPAYSTLSSLTAAAALVSSQAAGGMPYMSSSTALGTVSIGALYTFMRSTGSVPEYGSLIYKRQGGSSTDWSSAGTTTYTPTKTLMQSGSVTLTISSTGAVSVTFPTAFTYTPIVLATIYNTLSKRATLHVQAVSTTGCTFRGSDVDSESYSVYILWLAIGE